MRVAGGVFFVAFTLKQLKTLKGISFLKWGRQALSLLFCFHIGEIRDDSHSAVITTYLQVTPRCFPIRTSQNPDNKFHQLQAFITNDFCTS